MSEDNFLKDIKKGPHIQRTGGPVFFHVLACVDTSRFAQAVLAHATAVASAVDARLTVIRVLEPSRGQPPTDPVEWMLRHRDAEAELQAHSSRCGDLQAEVVVIDGSAAERICAWARDNGVDLTVMGVRGETNWPLAGLGGTSRRVAEATRSSVLLVSSTENVDKPVRYRRVMMPLDGSSRSECALPVALGLSAAHGAELVLVHAVPNVELTEIGPLEVEAITLRDRLRRRNELVADKYLKQVKSRLPRVQTTMRTRVLTSPDPRHALAQATADDGCDIIVLSSTGLSGHRDLSIGSVAEYLINHADKPILLVRGQECPQPQTRRPAKEAQTARLPGRALM